MEEETLLLLEGAGSENRERVALKRIEPLVRAPDRCGGSLAGNTSGLDTINNNGVEQLRRTMILMFILPSA